MLHFDNAQFRYKPYPHGFIENLFSPSMFEQLADSFPGKEGFEDWSGPDFGAKFLLREPQLQKVFGRAGIAAAPWINFLEYVHSRGFLQNLERFLNSHSLDLNLTSSTRWFRRGVHAELELSHTFAGGFQKPHTDSEKKILTILIPMHTRRNEWPLTAGGRTLICNPFDERRAFSFSNPYLDFKEVSVIDAVELKSNRALVFPRTNNSWHAVEPVAATCPAGTSRQMCSIIVFR